MEGGGSVIDIYFKDNDWCKNNDKGNEVELFFSVVGSLNIKITKNEIVKNIPVIYKWRAWDGDVCMEALSNSNNLLEQVFRVLLSE